MHWISRWLGRFFKVSDSLQQDLSDRWRPHANRRTLIVGLLLAALLIGSYAAFIRPPAQFPVNKLVLVPDGASLSEISVLLKEQGVIRSPLAFRALVTVLGRERGAHAGDYLFKEPQDALSVARAISIGAFGLEPERIRIAEGATTRAMAILYANRLLRFDPERFLELAQPQEGYLYPDTYFFLPNATEQTVIRTMRENFDIQTADLQAEIASSSRTLEEIITMASLVEREAHTTEDRKLIAGVLWNRIERNMPLQVDVAFLYTLGKNTFQLTREDLASDSPYNTYKNKGLPPTPIGSPSRESIEAALYPTKNSYLFYLADNDGVTHYSRTYDQHLRYKRMYLDS